MSNGKDGPVPHVEVDDAAAAFHRLEGFTRKILAVQKKDIEGKSPKTKAIRRNPKH